MTRAAWRGWVIIYPGGKLEDEPMTFRTKREALQYCEYGGKPIRVVMYLDKRGGR